MQVAVNAEAGHQRRAASTRHAHRQPSHRTWSALCPTVNSWAATRICSSAKPIQKAPADSRGWGLGQQRFTPKQGRGSCTASDSKGDAWLTIGGESHRAKCVLPCRYRWRSQPDFCLTTAGRASGGWQQRRDWRGALPLALASGRHAPRGMRIVPLPQLTLELPHSGHKLGKPAVEHACRARGWAGQANEFRCQHGRHYVLLMR